MARQRFPGKILLEDGKQGSASWQGEKDVAWIAWGLLVVALVVMRVTMVKFGKLLELSESLRRSAAAAREDLLPLMDDMLYQSVRAWRRKHPKDKALVLGHTSSCDADRLVRAFYRLEPTPDEERRVALLVGKIGAKLDTEIAIHVEQ